MNITNMFFPAGIFLSAAVYVESFSTQRKQDVVEGDKKAFQNNISPQVAAQMLYNRIFSVTGLTSNNQFAFLYLHVDDGDITFDGEEARRFLSGPPPQETLNLRETGNDVWPSPRQ